MTEPTKKNRLCPWFVAAVVILIAFTGYTRLSAPWAFGVTNEDMLHLQSWRNHYGTDDIYPIFVRKVESMGLLEGERLEQFKRAYYGSTLFQRGLLVLNDLHPPLYPLLAEISATLSNSSLIAVRMISAVSSILAVFLIYRLGRQLRDPTLGLWLATLLAIGFLIQVYAGIARPYALAQCALALAWCAFVREQGGEDASPWRFWLAAAFAQSTNWLVWSIIGPMVVVAMVQRLRRDGFLRLVLQSWWYVLITVFLLLVMLVQMKNPVTADATKQFSLDIVWWQYCIGSPLASLDLAFGLEPGELLSPAGILFVFAFVAGAACLIADTTFLRAESKSGLSLPAVRFTLFLAFAASLVTSIVGAGGIRMMVVYTFVPTIFAAVGLRWLIRSPRIARMAVIVVLVVFAVIKVGRPVNLFERLFWNQTEYDKVAVLLAGELDPGDQWCSYPMHWANCLYRYAELPDPEVLISRREFEELVNTLPREDGSIFVFAEKDMIDSYRILRRAPGRWDFINGFVLVEVPPRDAP